MTLKKSVLFMLNGQPKFFGTIVCDLLKFYGGRYRIVVAESAIAILEALRKMWLRNEPIVLFLVPQTMQETTGVGFLRRAMEVYPKAKRVLLAAPGDAQWRST